MSHQHFIFFSCLYKYHQEAENIIQSNRVVFFYQIHMTTSDRDVINTRLDITDIKAQINFHGNSTPKQVVTSKRVASFTKEV